MNKNNIIDYELERKLNKKKFKHCAKSKGAHSKKNLRMSNSNFKWLTILQTSKVAFCDVNV
jgi:hypothetical protein